MAAANAFAGTYATLQHGTYTGASLDSIQNVFHFNTNNFLLPEPGEETALDYAELFSVLNDANGQRSGGSSGGMHSDHADSGGGVLSYAPTIQPQQHQGSAGRLPQADATKTSRDANSKRVRDTSSSKNKQLQVKELEALAAKKSEEMERLTRENSELKFRKHLLEKVVRLRDHQLKVMRSTTEPVPEACCEVVPGSRPAASSDGSGAGGATSSGSGSGCGSGAVCAPGGGGGGSEVSACEVIRTRSCGCLLAAQGPGTPTFDRERYRSMGKMQLMEIWKVFLSEMSVPLLAVESDPGDQAAAADIMRLVQQSTFLFKHVSLLAPDTVMMASQIHLENETLSPPEPAHWRNVVHTLELSLEQVTELRAVYQLFSAIMRGIVAERKVINERLATGLHGTFADVAKSLEKLTISPECEVLQNLQRSMRREKSAHLLLRGFLFGQTLSVLQFAKAAVYSYPWMPDATALVATIVELADGGELEGLGGAANSRG